MTSGGEEEGTFIYIFSHLHRAPVPDSKPVTEEIYSAPVYCSFLRNDRII